MTAKKVQPTRIDYPKQWLMFGTFVWAVATTLLAYLALSAMTDVIRAMWIAVGLFEGILLGYLFVPPLFTHHMLGAKGLRLHMGLSINETIPYEWIKEARETSITWGAVRVGVGVRYSPIMKVMFVTSSFQSLVKLKLDKEHRIGSPFKRPVEELVLNVHSATLFMDQLRERAVAAEEV